MTTPNNKQAGGHTSGPWTVNENPGRHPAGALSISAGKYTWGIAHALPCDEIDANARLIAAAPELLAACKRALKTIEELPPRLNEDRYEPLMELSAAIAKAEGRAQ